MGVLQLNYQKGVRAALTKLGLALPDADALQGAVDVGGDASEEGILDRLAEKATKKHVTPVDVVLEALRGS